jgi:hypothetical protein
MGGHGAEQPQQPPWVPPYSLWLYAFMALPYKGVVGFIAKAMQMAYGSAINQSSMQSIEDQP